MKRFRLTLTVFTLLSLCLLVSAKDAAERGIIKKIVSFVKDKVINTRPTFYGECERKNKTLFGTCGKDTECVPKESGCKGACACDKTGVNECKWCEGTTITIDAEMVTVGNMAKSVHPSKFIL